MALFDDNIEHVTFGCLTHVKKEYAERHGKALIYINREICKHYDVEVHSGWYEHEPSTVFILEDIPILTE